MFRKTRACKILGDFDHEQRLSKSRGQIKSVAGFWLILPKLGASNPVDFNLLANMSISASTGTRASIRTRPVLVPVLVPVPILGTRYAILGARYYVPSPPY